MTKQNQYVAYVKFLYTSCQEKENFGKICFFDYHNDCFFVLAREDTKVSNIKKLDWVYPSSAKKKENSNRLMDKDK